MAKKDTRHLKQGLLFGTVALLLSNIFVKGLGFLYRVILVRLIGTEGMGLVEMVNPLFGFVLVIGGWGIALAVSKMTAEAEARGQTVQVRKIFSSALITLIISGLLISFLTWALSPFIIKNFAPDPRIRYCFQLLIPSIFIICVASAFRGFFQGMQRITAIGNSQSIEQAVRFIVGILLASQFISAGVVKASGAIAIGTLAGETAGLIYLVSLFWRQRSLMQINGLSFSPKVAAKLISFGTPVTFYRVVSSAIMMLQAFLIPLALQRAGLSVSAATAAYGCFSGVAVALLHLPGVFTSALSVSVLPAVAESNANPNLLQHRISNSLQATTVFTLPGMVLLNIFAAPLCSLIFHNSDAALPLQILTWGGIFIYMQVTLISILQGLGHLGILLRNNIISGGITLGLVYLLTANSGWGIRGTALASTLGALLGFALNFSYLLRREKLQINWSNVFLKPLGACALAFGAVHLFSKFSGLLINSGSKLGVIILMVFFIGVYFAALSLCGGLSIGVWRRLIKRR
ncbi:MAG: polysaccharide biosynthesis protein [Clostridiales bacterium]|nr:polysaccharide biosynthesis protein [Clostridiales bacterium]